MASKRGKGNGQRGKGNARRGLPRGPQALPREEVAADQRERLFEALIELINECGFAGVRISELVARARISRRSFYEQFPNKEECLLAAFDASVERLTRGMVEAYDPEAAWSGQIEAIVGSLFKAAAERPEAARLVCVDVSAAGQAGMARWAQGAERFERVLCAVFERAPGAGTIPDPVAKAVVGALRRILYARVQSGRSRRALRADLDRTLPDLVGWISSYYPSPPGIPQRPRRRAWRRPGGGAGGQAAGRAPGTLASLSQGGTRGLPPGEHNLPRGFVEHNQRERIFDAIANLTAARGYQALSLEDIAAEAAVSLQTFYSHFESKEEAFVATYEVGHARTVGVCAEAFASQASWAEGVRAGIAALLEFLAAEPSYAHLSCVDIVVAFPRLTERVEQASSSYAELLEFGLGQLQGADGVGAKSSVVSEAIVGGVFELLNDYVARGLTARLPELADHASYIALTPFIGSEAAAAMITSTQ